jgi:hypothetical protein
MTAGLRSMKQNHFLTVASAAMTTAAATLCSSRVFTTTIMTRITYVAPSIPCLVCVEVAERLFPSRWCRPRVTVARIVAIVHVTIEAVRTVEPGASPDKQPTIEPIRSIVSVRGTAVGSIVIIAIRTSGFRSYVDADLSRRSRTTDE